MDSTEQCYARWWVLTLYLLMAANIISPHAIREIYLNTNKDKCDSSPERFVNCPRIYRYEDDVRAGQQVLSKDIADKMTNLLRGVVSNGTGINADISAEIGKDIAGKTGTSTDSQDGWFIGYIPNEMVTGVWLGNYHY